MDDGLHIHRFHALHRVADDDGRRLAAAAQAQLLDGELEAALQRVAPADDVVLVRRLSLRIRLSAAHSDHDNARAWGDALALDLERVLRQGSPHEVLRFARRQQALAAFVEDLLQQRSARDWAWQRLGLLPPTRSSPGPRQRREALMRLLADDEAGVPLLRVLLQEAVWEPLLAGLEEAELRGLVLAVAARLAGYQARDFQASCRAAESGTPEAAQAGIEAGSESPGWLAPTRRAAPHGSRALWALRLAVMLAQPWRARQGAAAVDRAVAPWLNAAKALAPAPAAGISPRPASPSPAVRQPSQDAGGAAGEPASRAAGPVGRPLPAAQRTLAPAAARPAGVRFGEVSSSPAPERAGWRGSTEAEQPQRVGFTAFGGLLLLLPALPLCGALALLEDVAVWPEQDLPGALHALALRLWPMAADDPAALAFCGRGPKAAPPLPDLTPAQACALDAALERLLAHLAERLPDWRGPALLARVVVRPAWVVADPGWIDLVFPLREVSVELRRAALDLDPGFLPWLGVVLRYRYE